MALILPSKTAGVGLSEKFQPHIVKIVQGFFKFDVSDRITVIADQHQFKVMEDKSVWEQAKGVRPNWFEIYWDGVWMCDCSEKATKAQIGVEFMKGFVKAYEKGEVSLNTPKEIEANGAEKALNEEIERIKKQKTSGEAESIQKQVVLELLEEKKPKKKK